MFRNNYFVRPSLTTGTLFVLFFVSVVLFISKQVAAQGTSTDATPRTGGEYSADTIPAQETLPERMPRFGDDVQPVDGFTRSATGTERAANRSAAREARQLERAAASTERRNAALEAAEERGAARAERQETRETNRASRQAARTERLDERRAALTEAQAERERVREERIAEIAARREERIAALKEAAQTRVMNRGNAAITALERVASRLREHAGLVENRLDELSSAGIDVTTADQTLDSAVRTLSEAGDAIDMLRLDIEYVITSDTPREDWAAAKSQFRSVRDVLAETRSALRETVGELREAIREAEAGADTAQNENGA